MIWRVQRHIAGQIPVFANKPRKPVFRAGHDPLALPASASVRKKLLTESEAVFGDIKHNRDFRRFFLRGLKKVEAEWEIISIVQNIRKLAAQ